MRRCRTPRRSGARDLGGYLSCGNGLEFGGADRDRTDDLLSAIPGQEASVSTIRCNHAGFVHVLANPPPHSPRGIEADIAHHVAQLPRPRK